MCASLETLVVAAYVFADSFSFPRPGPAGKVTDQELIALAVAQAVTGICSDRQFLGRDMANRARALDTQAEIYTREIEELVRSLTPQLLDEPGIGPISAGRLLAFNPATMWAMSTPNLDTVCREDAYAAY